MQSALFGNTPSGITDLTQKTKRKSQPDSYVKRCFFKRKKKGCLGKGTTPLLFIVADCSGVSILRC